MEIKIENIEDLATEILTLYLSNLPDEDEIIVSNDKNNPILRKKDLAPWQYSAMLKAIKSVLDKK